MNYINKIQLPENISSIKDVNEYYDQNINDYLEDKSIDFIMTDPPYGGLVKYFDLSLIWLNWLKKIDKTYTPDLPNEITINSKKSNLESIHRKIF